MRLASTVYALIGLVIGALSDVFLIRNGLSYGGPTLLDKIPILWPVWLAFILLCAFLLEWQGRSSQEKNSAYIIPGPALAIWLGAIVTHAILFARDLILDPTTHSLWPFEFLFWGIVVAVPAFLGWLLARTIFKARTSTSPQ
jgi:hypothetical protein